MVISCYAVIFTFCKLKSASVDMESNNSIPIFQLFFHPMEYQMLNGAKYQRQMHTADLSYCWMKNSRLKETQIRALFQTVVEEGAEEVEAEEKEMQEAVQAGKLIKYKIFKICDIIN